MSLFNRSIPADHYSLPGRKERMVSSSGEFNAGSKKELLNTLIAAMQEGSNGSFTDPEGATSGFNVAHARAEAKAKVIAAANDPVKQQELGLEIAEAIKQADDRQGFMTQLMMQLPVENGVLPFIPFDKKVVTIGVAAAPSNFFPQVVRGTYHVPQEVELKANVKIEKKEIQLRGDYAVEKAYEQGMEQVSVGKDRLMLGAMKAVVGITHPQYNLVGRMTPTVIGEIKTLMEDFNVPGTTLILANNFWADVADWQQGEQINPFSSYEIFKTGRVAEIYGLNLITDGFRVPTQRVLDSGEFYLITEPEFFGMYTERGDIEVKSTDHAGAGSSDIGWFMSQFVSSTVVNSASVIRGFRSK